MLIHGLLGRKLLVSIVFFVHGSMHSQMRKTLWREVNKKTGRKRIVGFVVGLIKMDTKYIFADYFLNKHGAPFSYANQKYLWKRILIIIRFS